MRLARGSCTLSTTRGGRTEKVSKCTSWPSSNLPSLEKATTTTKTKCTACSLLGTASPAARKNPTALSTNRPGCGPPGGLQVALETRLPRQAGRGWTCPREEGRSGGHPRPTEKPFGYPPSDPARSTAFKKCKIRVNTHMYLCGQVTTEQASS